VVLPFPRSYSTRMSKTSSPDTVSTAAAVQFRLPIMYLDFPDAPCSSFSNKGIYGTTTLVDVPGIIHLSRHKPSSRQYRSDASSCASSSQEC
jgi:hypothetical protein